MQQRLGPRPPGKAVGVYTVLSLDKAWHGVHYVLSGTVEPGAALLSRAVLGGTWIGEGFYSYGPARFFTAAEVAELAAVLDDPGTEQEAAERYDSRRMNELQIYPFGWDDNGRAWILDALGDLRAFYSEAAARGRAVVTCLV